MRSTLVAYQYVLNGGPARAVQAPSGTASVQVTPTREQSELTVYAVAADGTVSGRTTDFFSSVAASPAADHGMNGDGTGRLSYTQYLLARHWQRNVPLTTLEAADLNGDGVPDLWAVTQRGIARAYLVSGLSATGPAEIEPQKPQRLS